MERKVVLSSVDPPAAEREVRPQREEGGCARETSELTPTSTERPTTASTEAQDTAAVGGSGGVRGVRGEGGGRGGGGGEEGEGPQVQTAPLRPDWVHTQYCG